MKATLERVDKDTWRLVRGNDVTALILRFSSGRWGLFDTNERRLAPETFERPVAARDHFNMNFPGGV